MGRVFLVSAAFLTAETSRSGQLPYATVSDHELGLPPDLTLISRASQPEEIPGRRKLETVAFSDLSAPTLAIRATPLPEADTQAGSHFRQRRLGRLAAKDGSVAYFNPEIVLAQFRGQPLVSALRVEPMREWDAVQALRRRPDVAFAVLDTFERRQFTPDDPLLGNQWHHGVIGSFQAWNISLGSPTVRVAIVDAPFQMDHPDLAPNTDAGWDVDASQPVTSSAGIAHSTLCAGMAAAVINNGIGVAGAANCRILPININGAISEMYDATLWAASNNVRVVNISWSGATNEVLEEAGLFLKTNANGLLVMSAVDGNGPLNGTNQPDICCVSMTDAADNFEVTKYGPYIDLAAPGYQIYSTTTGSGYATASGCSFAAPLVAGVIAWMLGENPTLAPEDVMSILTNTAVDLGPAGWDEYYGWGRINFAAAASATVATLPNIASVQWTNNAIIVAAPYRPGLNYTLWRSPQIGPANWSAAPNIAVATNGALILLADPAPLPFSAFYRVSAAR